MSVPQPSPQPGKSSLFKGLYLKILLIVIIVLAIVGAGFAQLNRPYPPVAAAPVTAGTVLPGKFSVTFPAQGEAAVGTENLGVVASSPDQASVAIASVAKIMTAYLVLKAHPLQPGESGPVLTMTAQDVADYQQGLQNNYSVLKVTQGEQLTERQLLEGLLLPSGDNIADTLARWVSGSDSAFVAKMNETAKSLKMTSTHYADASGVSPATVSSAVDQIKLAQAAMQDRAFRSIVAMPQAILPVAGKVFNVDGMLGKHGIVGIKTGSTSEAGGCFISATPVVDGSSTHYIIGAVLGQKTALSLQSAFDATVQMLDQVRPEFKSYTLPQPAGGFAQISTAWHAQSPLKTTQPVQVFGYPGLKVQYSTQLLHSQLPLAVGDQAANLKVQAGSQVQTIPLRTVQKVTPPGLLWKLFRL
ncbi:serine-type D-Ala-D-Ala carboxypeptidase [Acididesulfobacillus acetoxydans]|uniref:Peptidase S11 D-alanyl-D-alanine carboxypeptidase 1 n=1 Tax=Acididesulfobacillus acetoxydans TaxID=1561005 RepID=A0A8S0X190_9FIRM|nr:D-alanyl-D-alanine carboxypeptidase [Acididesulfobacillus acetoxydans]CAA7603001.1 serine-type D-Ala-D-Ala carboxypeptidase [Acididesulfobacillus acetoxydans]CEJ05883.1 Peptidase S11 D-alanyl-D-alanine carboxypeptidase 1 [Acididesulfobacillus acetoxydans]